MPVANLSLKALKDAIDAAITQISTDCGTAVTELVGTSSNDGWASYQKANDLYTLVSAQNGADEALTLLNSAIGTAGGDLSALPENLKYFNQIANAFTTPTTGIDAILNLTGADEDFDTLVEIVNYMLNHENQFEQYLANALAKSKVRVGTGTFNGTTGAAITFTTAMGSANYRVLICMSSKSTGTVGEYWVEGLTATGFTVKCSGTGTNTFDYIVIDNA